MTLVMSLYVFPISFTFLPDAVNSKILIAVFGILAFAYDSLYKRAMQIPGYILSAGVMAVIFSVWCYFSIVLNNSTDTTYSTYIVSFLTWMFGAYGVYATLKMTHEEVDVDVMTTYLAYAGVFQCVSAVLIDNIPAFSDFVDRFMDQGQDFYKTGNRLYGIGAALDPAGIRFSVILVLIAHQFAINIEYGKKNLHQAEEIVAFATITIVGAVISRTTLVGMSLGVAYILLSLIKVRTGGFVTTQTLGALITFILVMLALTGVILYLYNHNEVFYQYLRFGFEAFFNWVETGEFTTNSSEQLQQMWVWPDDFFTWIFGRGTFGVFDNNTDIGYCNFVFYCGLVGLSLFSIYFIYCHWVLRRKFHSFTIPSLLLIALTFIIWIKVTTDIFFVDALLFCAAADNLDDENWAKDEEDLLEEAQEQEKRKKNPFVRNKA